MRLLRRVFKLFVKKKENDTLFTMAIREGIEDLSREMGYTTNGKDLWGTAFCKTGIAEY